MKKLPLSGMWRPRWWGIFVLAGAFFMGFGVASFSLFRVLQANLALFVEHGVMVIGDGAGAQLLELIGMGYLSLLLWIGFKVCECTLVATLSEHGRND